MVIDNDYQQIVRLAGVRSRADMRRLFGSGWKTINPSQQVWIRHLLSVWGDHLSGDEHERGDINLIGRLMMHCEWSEQKSKLIERVVTALHCEGYRGEELMRKARDMLVPQSSASNIIALAKESDDAAFMESVIVKTFGRDNPLRAVARLRYCKYKSAQNIASSLIYFTGITLKEARNRMEWAQETLEEELFHAVMCEQNKNRRLP